MKKTALITGAASGIGHNIAINLLKLGYEVIAIDKQFCKFPENVTSHTFDLKDEISLSEVINSIGQLDIAVNCAGVPCTRKPLIEFTSAEIINDFHENFVITFNAMKFEIIKMQSQCFGKIINIGSSTAHRGMKNMLAYSSSKSSIVNMTKVAAIENAPFNIQINSISPASIDTPMLRNKYKGVLPDYSNTYYTHACGSVDDVFSAVKMFIENNFFTGHDLVIDGGLSDLCDISKK